VAPREHASLAPTLPGVDDRSLVARQIGREPRAFLRVAVRCPYGYPAVTEQTPLDETGSPFPTTYWLTCRHLVAAVSRVEAAAGVERWTDATRGDQELAESLERANEQQRALTGLGIGGSSRGGSLKCLHAHIAYALARPEYELGQRILAELELLWPPDRCCSAPG
jgi:uncharacterized protein